jgi:hypothetical protein
LLILIEMVSWRQQAPATTAHSEAYPSTAREFFLILAIFRKWDAGAPARGKRDEIEDLSGGAGKTHPGLNRQGAAAWLNYFRLNVTPSPVVRITSFLSSIGLGRNDV